MIFRSIRISPKCVKVLYYQHQGSLKGFLGPQVKQRANALRFSTKRQETSKAEDDGSQVAYSQTERASGDVIPSTKRKKTMAELDAELREKLEGLSGDGGSAGVEYENGTAEGLKRGVKANMFRVI